MADKRGVLLHARRAVAARSRQALDGDWSALFGTYGVAWAVVEWGGALTAFVALNGWLARTSAPATKNGAPELTAPRAP